jgi:hypothetical protein
MGEPKLKLRSDAAKASGRYPAGVLEDPEPIAQRFAHAAGSRRAALRPADRPTVSQLVESLAAAREATASAARGWLFRPRVLVAGLGLAALVLCLILGALWLGSNSESQQTALAPAPGPQAETSAVLTAPERIEAIAGEHVRFPIALDGTDGVPSRSIVAIKGLPQGSNFSEGRPFGESEWTLRPDQIGDLNLALPAAAVGEFKLGIALIAPDDKVVAETATLLAIAPATAPPVEPPAAVEASTSPTAGAEAALLEPVPRVSETGVLGPRPDAGHDSGAELTEEPGAAEAAATPLVESPAEEGEQSMEGAAAPSGEAQPASLEPTESGLGTVEPAMFVNMREGPSSSAPVLGVVAKGIELAVLDRKRGWVQVTDPATGKTGWIYSGLLVGEAKANQRVRRVAPAEPELQSESLWGRLGRWLSPSQEKSSGN